MSYFVALGVATLETILFFGFFSDVVFVGFLEYNKGYLVQIGFIMFLFVFIIHAPMISSVPNEMKSKKIKLTHYQEQLPLVSTALLWFEHNLSVGA